MDPELTALFERLRETATYANVHFDDVNATNSDGDNALHWAVRSNDRAAARMLIDAGIEVNPPGDLGYTPLHEACAAGNADMVMLLLQHGADLYARREGDTPFSVARLCGHDALCDLLRPLMEQAQRKDPQVWVRVRVRHLETEIRRLKAQLE
jgi:ankyrin repeat protein